MKLTYSEFPKRKALVICSWLVWGIFLQFSIKALYPFSFREIIESEIATSFYAPALKYNVKELLKNYNDILQYLPIHARSNMPGKLIFFKALYHLVPDPQYIGYLILLFSNLGAILVYFISRRLFRDELTALYSLILYLFLPSKIYFFPILNTVSPVFILFAFFIYLKCPKGWIYQIIFGLSVFVCFLFEPLLLASLIILCMFSLSWYLKEEISFSGIAKMAFVSCVTFFSALCLFSFLFDHNLLKTFLMVVEDAQRFNMEEGRPYWIWVLLNPLGFFINLGFVQALLFWIFTLRVLKDTFRNGSKTLLESLKDPISNLVLSFLFTLLILNFMGINRGEVERLWIFLMVYVGLIISYYCRMELGRFVFYFILTATLFQILVTATTVSFVIP
jgi:hypothetical protein